MDGLGRQGKNRFADLSLWNVSDVEPECLSKDHYTYTWDKVYLDSMVGDEDQKNHEEIRSVIIVSIYVNVQIQIHNPTRNKGVAPPLKNKGS